MRRVFGNDFELDAIRIYKSGRLMDTKQPEQPEVIKFSGDKKEEEMDFSQLLNKEISALSTM